MKADQKRYDFTRQKDLHNVIQMKLRRNVYFLRHVVRWAQAYFEEPCTMEGLTADQIICSIACTARSPECDRGEKMQPMLENWALIPH